MSVHFTNSSEFRQAWGKTKICLHLVVGGLESCPFSLVSMTTHYLLWAIISVRSQCMRQYIRYYLHNHIVKCEEVKITIKLPLYSLLSRIKLISIVAAAKKRSWLANVSPELTLGQPLTHSAVSAPESTFSSSGLFNAAVLRNIIRSTLLHLFECFGHKVWALFAAVRTESERHPVWFVSTACSKEKKRGGLLLGRWRHKATVHRYVKIKAPLD